MAISDKRFYNAVALGVARKIGTRTMIEWEKWEEKSSVHPEDVIKSIRRDLANKDDVRYAVIVLAEIVASWNEGYRQGQEDLREELDDLING